MSDAGRPEVVGMPAKYRRARFRQLVAYLSTLEAPLALQTARAF